MKKTTATKSKYRVLVARTYGEWLTVKAYTEDHAWQLARNNDASCEYEAVDINNCTEHFVCEVHTMEG